MRIKTILSQEQQTRLTIEDRKEEDFYYFLGKEIKNQKKIAKRIDLDLYLKTYKPK